MEKSRRLEATGVYFVLDGGGKSTIDGEEIFIEKSDVVIVPKIHHMTIVSTGRTLKLFWVHAHAYSPEFDVNL